MDYLYACLLVAFAVDMNRFQMCIRGECKDAYNSLCVKCYAYGDTTCPNGWMPFDGSCYLFGHDQGLKFVEAEHFCAQLGSHLVHVNDVHENNFLRDMLTRLKPSDYWIGLTDQMIEDEWRWSGTDIAPEYTDWSPGEPESAHHTANEDCAGFLIQLNFHWVDLSCDALWQPLCEKGDICGKKRC